MFSSLTTLDLPTYARQGLAHNPQQQRQQQHLSKAQPVSVDVGTACVPHHDKLMKGLRARVERHVGYGGDDAYFVRRVHKVIGLGVADGVYEWQKQVRWRYGLKTANALFAVSRKSDDDNDDDDDDGGGGGGGGWVQGIDSSIYSRALMRYTSKAIEDGVTCPVRSLTRAWECVTSKQIKGSTTATIVIFEEDKVRTRLFFSFQNALS